MIFRLTRRVLTAMMHSVGTKQEEIMRRRTFISLALLGIGTLMGRQSFAADNGTTLRILLTDGSIIEGTIKEKGIKAIWNGAARTVAWKELLSVHSGEHATRVEVADIIRGLDALQGEDRAAQDTASERLTDIGVAVLTPLLNTLKDADAAREPKPLYRLFERILPNAADGLDRNLDLFRLANGDMVRAKIEPEAILNITDSEGKVHTMPQRYFRRLAVRRKEVKRSLTVHALYHCTQIAWLDTGIVLSPNSNVESHAKGFVRLAFNEDGWTSEPDGLQKPGPNYNTNLTDGFPFGALLTKTGASGKRILAGRAMKRSDLGTGRWYFAINDNPHWQNNLGTYRLTVRATHAYDVGEPQ
jgi:hypothetical protein